MATMWNTNSRRRVKCNASVMYVAILANSCQSRSLNTQIIWNKSTHESCMLMATETIAMHGLASSLLNHS